MTEPYPKIYLYRRIVQAKIFIDNHFSDVIDLDNISGEAYFSKFHFLRLFKNIYGKTPHQYLTFVRIEKAKQMLQTGTPATEVAYSIGYDSVSSFTGLFKRIVGATPSAYQQRQLELKAEMLEVPLKFVPHCFAEAKGWTRIATFEK